MVRVTRFARALPPQPRQEGSSMYAFRALSASLVASALALAVHTHVANAATLSDRMVITDPTGAPIFDQSIPEVPTAVETSLTFAGGPAPVSPPPIPITSAITIP